ncbi:porin [Porticoccus sp. GXU_MW_L64]
MFKKSLVAVTIAALSATAVAENDKSLPPLEEMWKIIQQQNAEINALKKKLNETDQQLQETEVKVVATAEAVEQVVVAPVSRAASWAEKTRIGAYGEVLYNNGTQRSDNASPSNPNKEIDVQRFVTYLGHEFTEDVRFFSELEVEHTNTAGAGEVELEQAYIEWDYADKHSVLAGLHLVPVGILNETHEPETFYGVERNRIESRIIPTTYRVNGVKFKGELSPGWSYDFAVHEGLQLASNFSVRSSRQGGSRANAEELASTGRIKFTGIQGLELGLALHYQSDLIQDNIGNSRLGRPAFSGPSISGLLTETHAIYQNGPFGLRALYAQWDIDDEIEALGGVGRDEQEGWYIEPSYKLTENFGLFTRYESVDETAGDNDNTSEERRILVGANYWLTDRVVLKGDIQFENDRDNGDDLDGFNLGIGWSFD